MSQLLRNISTCTLLLIRLCEFLILILWVFLPSSFQAQAADKVPQSEDHIGGMSGLWGDPFSVNSQRQKFQDVLPKTPVQQRRSLYERYLGIIGINGILDSIEILWPHCHSEAHDLGKVIYAQVQDIAEGLRLCDERCHSGCMHGVLMEAITTEGWTEGTGFDVEALKPFMSPLCMTNPQLKHSYSPGDCAHGVGHALTVVGNYRIQDALRGCELFENEKAEYYCATGVYMEYVNVSDESDYQTKSLLYPCDTFSFPAACARYKMVHVVRRHYQAGRDLEELKNQCRQFPTQARLGCFHGLGNAHVPYLAKSLVSLKQVCEGLTKNEEIVCIDGAIERLAKYHEPRALEVCQEFHEEGTTNCLSAVRHKMYNMEKELRLYLSP
jgi:hypothetical protein